MTSLEGKDLIAWAKVIAEYEATKARGEVCDWMEAVPREVAAAVWTARYTPETFEAAIRDLAELNRKIKGNDSLVGMLQVKGASAEQINKQMARGAGLRAQLREKNEAMQVRRQVTEILKGEGVKS